jgi:serine/threonine protein kinase/tetratricopeptide (TPR) repeat protein
MLAVGTQLGPYQVLAPLGSGGMGEVYRAKDRRLDREVAVKVLPQQFSQDPNRLARFEREAKAVAALSHPSILAIHDYGTEQGVSYAVMELLEGDTLRSRVAHAALPWRKAAEVGVALADGLAAAHAKGILHRDLKPENIFLTADGRVKILDFGLARVEPAVARDAPTGSYHPAATDPGTALGTVGYMSPEQVRGQPVDARSDLFSLGCVLYEMVAGRRAFLRETAVETQTAILHDEPPDLADSGKAVPVEVERVIRHCLEKSPAARFHSAHDLAFALRAILTDSSLAKPAPAPASSRPVRWIVAALVLVAVLGTTSAYLLTRDAKTPEPTPPVEPPKAIESVAVLPFENVGGDPKMEPLCATVADSLIDSLAQLRRRDLLVRPFTSVSRYRGKTIDVRQVGQELGVKAIVTGRLSQQGELLTLSVELVDAPQDSRLWGKRYSGKLQEILALQDVLAKDLAVNLRLQLTGEEVQRLTRHHTEDVEAYLLYKEGRYHQSKFTPEGAKIAIEYFERALKKDPNYARAYGGLATCYIMLGNHYLPPREAFPKAKELLAQALKLDDTLADTHGLLALVCLFYEWEWAMAEKHATRAMQLDPNDPRGHDAYHWYLVAMGRVQEALAAAQRAAELDPLAPLRHSSLAHAYIAVGQYDAAIGAARRALELADKFLMARCDLGLALALKEQYAEAIAELQRARADTKDHPMALGVLGAVYARAGRPADARPLLAELQRLPGSHPHRAYSLACIYASLGEKNEAFAWLGHAPEVRGVRWLNLKVDPLLEPLRSDPRFKDLLRRLKLPGDSEKE